MEIKTIVLGLFMMTFVACEENTTTVSSTSSTSSNITTTENPSTTTHGIKEQCRASNATCEDCLNRSPKCYYCRKTKKCDYYPYRHIVPRYEECGSMGDVAWGTCLINFEILIISMSVVGGVLILSLIICCCCCCRKRGLDKWAKQQEKWERQREERKAKSLERKKERQTKTDEIRRKYGLLLDASGLMKDDNPYQRFDNA